MFANDGFKIRGWDETGLHENQTRVDSRVEWTSITQLVQVIMLYIYVYCEGAFCWSKHDAYFTG